jgi:hypothetical protein
VKENYCNSNFEYDPVKLMGNWYLYYRM